MFLTLIHHKCLLLFCIWCNNYQNSWYDIFITLNWMISLFLAIIIIKNRLKILPRSKFRSLNNGHSYYLDCLPRTIMCIVNKRCIKTDQTFIFVVSTVQVMFKSRWFIWKFSTKGTINKKKLFIVYRCKDQQNRSGWIIRVISKSQQKSGVVKNGFTWFGSPERSIWFDWCSGFSKSQYYCYKLFQWLQRRR